MKEKWLQVRDKALGFWNQYSKTQKRILAATAALLLLAVIILTVLFTRTEYEVVFQNLDSTDAAAIMQYLETNKIPYKLGDGGTSISVPSASATKVRVEVGAQGLVQSGSIGFGDIAKSSSAIGTTDQEFQVKYRNALDGEIQQLLRGMEGVDRVKVLVNLPQEAVFVSDADKERASASVQMQFKPGFRPNQDQIDSYFNLVKTAVPNLHIEDITITSQSGELTPSSKIGGTGAGASGSIETQFDVERQFKSDVKREIQQFIAPMVGMDNFVVNVAASLNFDKQQTQENLVKPLDNNNNNGIIISEQNTSKTSSGTDGQAGGVAGTGQTDIPNYPGNTGASSSTSEETSSTINYEVNRITNNIDYGPFKVKDLSISVAVDSAVMTPDKQQQIQQVLAQTVRTLLAESGQDLSDAAINQRVSVISQQFQGTLPSGGGMSASGYWLAGLGGLALALLAGGGYMLYRRRKQAREAALETEVARPELPTLDVESVTSESQVRRQLENLVRRKPDEFVNLLRTWLVDE